jgi:hypothetical protein
MVEMVESFDGLGARLPPARLGALPGPPEGNAWVTCEDKFARVATVNGILTFPAPAPLPIPIELGVPAAGILEVPCRLGGRIGTDLVDRPGAEFPTTVLEMAFVGVARKACGCVLFSFCLLDAGPGTDEVDEAVDMEKAVLA